MTDAATSTIDIGTIIIAAKPYINAIVSALIPAIVGWIALEAKKLFNIQIQKSAVDQISMYAQHEAGALVLAATDNLANASITVTSPTIATAAERIIKAVPDLLAKSGMTPIDVQTAIAGKLGELQANMTSDTSTTTVQPTIPVAPQPVEHKP